MDIKKLAKITKALSHPNRLEIFLSIVQSGQGDFETGKECCISELCGCRVSEFIERLGIGAPTVSHHLKELVNADLVFTERQDRYLIAKPNLELWAEVKQALFPER